MFYRFTISLPGEESLASRSPPRASTPGATKPEVRDHQQLPQLSSRPPAERLQTRSSLSAKFSRWRRWQLSQETEVTCLRNPWLPQQLPTDPAATAARSLQDRWAECPRWCPALWTSQSRVPWHALQTTRPCRAWDRWPAFWVRLAWADPGFVRACLNLRLTHCDPAVQVHLSCAWQALEGHHSLQQDRWTCLPCTRGLHQVLFPSLPFKFRPAQVLCPSNLTE